MLVLSGVSRGKIRNLKHSNLLKQNSFRSDFINSWFTEQPLESYWAVC